MGLRPWESTSDQRPRGRSGPFGRIATGVALVLTATVGGLALTAASAAAAPARSAAPVRGDATWLARLTPARRSPPAVRPALSAPTVNTRPAVDAGVAGDRAAPPLPGYANWIAAVAATGKSAAQPPDPVLAQRVAAWVTGGGEAELTALGRDFKALETDAKAQNLPAMSNDCKQLGVDVAAAQAYAPIPDTAAQTSWAAALDQYAHGATDCMNGALTQDYPRITKAATEIQAGSTDLDRVTARLNEIAG